MKFNNERFFELFRNRNSLNREEQRELLNYLLLTKNEVLLGNELEYRCMMSDFIAFRIDANQFIKEFLDLFRQNTDSTEFLQTYLVQKRLYLKLTFESLQLAKILNRLYERIMAEHDSHLKGFVDEPMFLSDEGLRKYVARICYPQMMKYFENEEILYKESYTRRQFAEMSEVKFYSYEEILELMEKDLLLTNTKTDWNDNQILNEMLVFFVISSCVSYLWLKPGLLDRIL